VRQVSQLFPRPQNKKGVARISAKVLSRPGRFFTLCGGRVAERCAECVDFGRRQIGDGGIEASAVGPLE
jgi:hypothetical protein